MSQPPLDNSPPVLPSFASITSSLPSAAMEQTGNPGYSLKKPGYGMPLNVMPTSHDRFPILIGDEDKDWAAGTLLIREACMLKMVDDLTNKPEWWLKVQNPDIAAQWKNEALTMNWAAYRNFGDFTPNMAEACLQEIQKKALVYQQTGLMPIFDYSACVIKSDKVVTPDLAGALIAAIKPLEDVPEDAKDWHPGSQGKVLDLVHPSLWPLMYGRSRILPDRQLNIGNCLDQRDIGCQLPVPSAEDVAGNAYWGETQMAALSQKFQWLPCDVSMSASGQAKIESYINNVHPVRQAQLYPVIERFIQKALPAWDLVYRWPKEFEFQRLTVHRVGTTCTTPDLCEPLGECRPWARPLNPGEEPRDDEISEEDYEQSAHAPLDRAWFHATHPIDVPDAKVETEGHSLKRDCVFSVKPEDVKTEGFFRGASRIQVIVKLANVHLTPEKPNFDGGSWHVEGQLNEHICSTAIFYYDSDNISESRLSFRTRSNAEELAHIDYEQNDIDSLARTFAIEANHDTTTLQEIGSALTPAGGALFFPNILQHHLEPFSLADATRPGHRKILALFLVDPAIPVISTANVPPQQRHWWPSDQQLRNTSSLPPELAALTVHNTDYTMDEAEAKRMRLELMAERTMLQDSTTSTLRNFTFNFCEH